MVADICLKVLNIDKYLPATAIYHHRNLLFPNQIPHSPFRPAKVFSGLFERIKPLALGIAYPLCLL